VAKVYSFIQYKHEDARGVDFRYYDLLEEIDGINFEIETYRKHVRQFPNIEYEEVIEDLVEEREELFAELDTYY
jgi:hypothetical protein